MSEADRMDAMLRKIEDIEYFIAHDYDSMDDKIPELVLRRHLPAIKAKLLEARNDHPSD